MFCHAVVALKVSARKRQHRESREAQSSQAERCLTQLVELHQRQVQPPADSNAKQQSVLVWSSVEDDERRMGASGGTEGSTEKTTDCSGRAVSQSLGLFCLSSFTV